MKRIIKYLLLTFVCACPLSVLSFAQSGVAGDIKGLQSVLDNIYEQMLPLCSSLIAVGRGLAGFAALWFIAVRVWRHIANAEPVDFYPLLRPFAIGLCVLIFPSVISLMNAILQPTVTGTNAMVTGSDAAIAQLLAQKQQAIENTDFYKMYVGPDGNGDRDKWYQYTHPDDPTGANEGVFESVGNDIRFEMSKMSYNFRNSIKEMMSEVLQVLYEAASLCINTIRTFNLILLAVIGPLVFGISVFDGFQNTLRSWIARYINVFLWLPVANIFGSIIGKIQQNMIQLDINQIQANGDTYFSSTDTGYLIFLIIGIVGFFTVPSISGYIVQASGGNALTHKVSNLSMAGAGIAGAAVGGIAGAGLQRIAQGAKNLWNAPGNILQGYKQGGSNSSGNNSQQSSDYMRDKLSGKSKNT